MMIKALLNNRWLSVKSKHGKNVDDGTSETLGVPRRSPIFLHPFVIFSAVWLGVVSLYSLHLSKLLIYSTSEISRIILALWAPLACVVLPYIPIRKILV